MIWWGGEICKLEEGEPSLRSCWECNSAHEHLKNVNFLHACYDCGRYWVFDRFLKTLDGNKDWDEFFLGKGLSPGDSTTIAPRGGYEEVEIIEPLED